MLCSIIFAVIIVFEITCNGVAGVHPVDMCDHLPVLEVLYISYNQFHGKLSITIHKCLKLVLKLGQIHIFFLQPIYLEYSSQKIKKMKLGLNI